MPWKKKAGMPTVKRSIHEIDAEGQVVGRLATKIAKILIGKHKASYVAHTDMGDIVKVKNAKGLVLTGKKWEQKVHFHSSNRPGGIKRVSMAKLREDNPSEILRHAVKYMLPKNRIQSERMKRLIIA
ncbi:MAG: 50S ribosomal protein L13 [Patescibacteria group bacterium]